MKVMIVNGADIKPAAKDKQDINFYQSGTETRSNEVQEILGQMPVWTIRLGIAIICFIICLVLLTSWFVTYPDVLSSRLTVTTQALSKQLYGQIKLPATSLDKITIGQKVNIRFDNYPAATYGITRGAIIAISSAPYQGQHIIQVQLYPSTSYHKKIIFKSGMQGNAEIIIRGQRLMEKIKRLKIFLDKISA